jgi:DNA-binding XRE family transcriptional regulator
MTHYELKALRARLKMTRRKMAEELGISTSRLIDFEMGFTRGRRTPAVIPRSIELALLEIARQREGVRMARVI